MAILRIRAADGTVQEVLAIRGESYVLTEADKKEIAGMIVEGNVDLSNYYDKEFLDPVIISADERLTSLEEIAAKSVEDFEAIVPPLADRVLVLEEGMSQIAEDATKAIADFEARISALENLPVYNGEVEDV